MDLRKYVGHQTLIQCAASIIIVNDKKEILLGKRTDNHKWGYAGGSMEIDESCEECAKRELLEETGLIADDMQLFMINSGKRTHYVYPNGDEVCNVEIVYICNQYHGNLHPEKSEIEELKFFPFEEIPEEISDPIVPVIEKFKEVYVSGEGKKQPLTKPEGELY